MSVATRYGLEGPGVEFRLGRDFLYLCRLALRPTQPPVQWVPAIKRPGRGADHPPPSSVPSSTKEISAIPLLTPKGLRGL